MLLHYISVRVFGPQFAGIFFVYMAAMLIISWCGYVPGILGVLFVVAGVPYLFKPNFSLREINPGGLIVLLLVSVMVSRTSAYRKRTELRLRETNDDLDSRVREKTAELASANAILAHANAELKRSEEQFRLLANSIPQLCWMARGDGWIFLVQRAVVPIHGHHTRANARLGMAGGT
jgi:PAS domain-containing protein